MDTPHLVHLVIVGTIFLAVLAGLGAFLRHKYPRSWWIQLLGFVAIGILATGKFTVH